MLIHLSTPSRAKQAAKYLKSNLAVWRIHRPLTWHQDTIAMMLGHSNWKELITSIGQGHPPSPLDKAVSVEEHSTRREYQTTMLIKRVGSEASKKNVGRDIFDKIVDHVAPSGVPTAGSSFAEKSAILTEHGIAIPMSSYTDIALLGWGNVPDQDEFAHVAAFYDPEVEEIYDLIFHHDGERATFDRCMQYVEGKASDNLDAVTILSMLYRSSGRLEDASDLVNDGFFIASLAWAPIAKARRRHHDPIRWWDEKSTRPLMRLLHEKGFVEVYSQTPEGASRARQTFGKLLALNPADPLNVRRFADTDIVFYDEEKVPELMESHAQRHRT